MPSAHVSPESRPSPGAGIVAITSPVRGSIFWIRAAAIWKRCVPSNAVPASPVTGSERATSPRSGSMASKRSPVAHHTCAPSKVTPLMRAAPGNGPCSRSMEAGRAGIARGARAPVRATEEVFVVMPPAWRHPGTAGSNNVVANPVTGGATQRRARARPSPRTFPSPSRPPSARWTVRWLAPSASARAEVDQA